MSLARVAGKICDMPAGWLARRIGGLVALACPLLLGCAHLHAYRAEPVFVESRWTTIQSFARAPIDPGEVDALLLDVARQLGVELDPTVGKAHVVVTTPGHIAALHGDEAAGRADHTRVEALYLPQASLVLIPYLDRELLGHEFAHYVTHHYLADLPRAEWESLALRVERRLRVGPRAMLAALVAALRDAIRPSDPEPAAAPSRWRSLRTWLERVLLGSKPAGGLEEPSSAGPGR